MWSDVLAFVGSTLMLAAIAMIWRTSRWFRDALQLQLRHNCQLVDFIGSRLPDDREAIVLIRKLTAEMQAMQVEHSRKWPLAWRRAGAKRPASSKMEG
jgi:hypothetical protein